MGSFPQRRSQGLLPRLMNRVVRVKCLRPSTVCKRMTDIVSRLSTLQLGIKTSVRYKPVAETGNYTIGVFTLDDVGSAIPLHDHPGMAVSARTVHEPLQQHSRPDSSACLAVESFSSCGTSRLLAGLFSSPRRRAAGSIVRLVRARSSSLFQSRAFPLASLL